MNELVPCFEESLFDTEIMDLGVEFLELGIDSVLEDGLFKDIPIVGTIVKVGKFAQNVHDRNLLNQTLIFINEFRKGRISEEKIQQHRVKLRKSTKAMEAELGRILILLNRNIDTIKIKFEAKFYIAFINGIVSWSEFCELCDITERLFISDIRVLKEAFDNNGISSEITITYKHDRLMSVGLLVNEASISGSVYWIDLDAKEQKNIIELTEVGRKFCNIVFANY